MKLESFYHRYLNNLKGGKYDLPPLLIICELLQTKFTHHRVSIKRLSNRDNVYRRAYEISGEFLNFLDNPITSKEYFKRIIHGNNITLEYENNLSDEDITILNNIVDNSKLIVNAKIYDKDWEVLIHFPKVTISNSENKSHEIIDLYMSIIIDPEGKIRDYPRLNRSTYTKGEVDYEYRHSHAGSTVDSTINSDLDKYSHFKNICLGSGPISNVLSIMLNEFSEVSFTLFLELLDKYLVWESIEGTPYQYIRNINSSGEGSEVVVGIDKYFNGSGERKISNVFIIERLIRNNKIFELILNMDSTKIINAFDENSIYSINTPHSVKVITDYYALGTLLYHIIKKDENKNKLIYQNSVNDLVLNNLINPGVFFTHKDSLDRTIITKKMAYRENSDRYNTFLRLKGGELFKFKNVPVTLKEYSAKAQLNLKDEKRTVSPSIMHNIIGLLEAHLNNLLQSKYNEQGI